MQNPSSANDPFHSVKAQLSRKIMLAASGMSFVAAAIALPMIFLQQSAETSVGHLRTFTATLVLLVSAISFLLAKANRIQLSLAIYAGTLLIQLFALPILARNGVYSISLIINFVLITLCGYIIRPILSLIVAGICCVATIGLFVLEKQELLIINPLNRPPSTIITIALVFSFLLLGWIIYRYAHLFNLAIDQLKDSHKALQESLIELTNREQDLIEARHRAETASRAKSQFLATMSHEIRTPLNGVLGMAQLMLNPDLPNQVKQDYAQTILSSGNTLLAVLNDILDWSKVEAGKLELEAIPFAPAAVLRESVGLFSEAAKIKHVALIAEEAGLANTLCEGDPTRLRQILMNLIGNALKFTPAGQVTVRVDAQPMNEGLHITYQVSDTGIGIPADKQALLFQPFSQVDGSTTRQFGGTGLGLAIVRRLIELMHGDIALHSQPGLGTTFTVSLTLPLSSQAASPPLAPQPQTGTTIDTKRARILVAEDNPINQKVIVAMLARNGHEVVCVDNGEAAMDALQQHPFDLVLMDCQMPVMGGLEATRLIRDNPERFIVNGIPIIAVTAGAFEDDRQQCLAAGMNDFLTKPINANQLQEVLARWLK